MDTVIRNDLRPHAARFAEIMAFGPTLRDEAACGCGCLNDSYFLQERPKTIHDQRDEKGQR